MRCPPEKRPLSLYPPLPQEDATLKPDSSVDKPRRWWSLPGRKNATPKYDESLVRALNQTFFWRFWISGILRLFSGTLLIPSARFTTLIARSVILQIATPLVSKSFIEYVASAYIHARLPEFPAPRGIAHGIGLAFALFFMTMGSSLLENHSMNMAMSIGVMARTSVCAFKG
jgi:ATP-binding cassette subfamily C (CFTR/MRP) protein 1